MAHKVRAGGGCWDVYEEATPVLSAGEDGRVEGTLRRILLRTAKTAGVVLGF